MKKFIKKIHDIEELFVGYALLLIAIAATFQVFMRYVLNLSYDWIDEASRYMIVMITFIGAGICVRYGSHFAMDAWVQYSPNRVKHALKIAANLVSTIVMAVVFYFSWIHIETLYRYEVSTASLQIPMFIPYLPIGIFTLVIGFRFFVLSIIHSIAFINDQPFDQKKGGH